jgi:hypothetical protein
MGVKFPPSIVSACAKCALFVGLFVLLAFGTGCGALSAMANPKVGWALRDPAPMSVVVRRADAAESTAKEVDRLLASTTASADSAWLAASAPSKEDAAAEMKALLEDPQYKTSHARVVAAEVWARTLDDVKSGEALASDKPNLLALVSAELGEKFERVMEKKRDIGNVRTQIAAEEEARDKKDASDAEKKEHKTKIEALEKQLSALEKEVSPLQKEFIAAAKDLAKKSSPEVREKVGPVLVNLRQAVDDAEIANGAAAVRYPLAISSLVSSMKEMIPVFIADIIEERTGKRPSMQGLTPDVALEGTDVKLTINGLSKDDLGKIDIADLTLETARRGKTWLGRVAMLIGIVAANKETLSFEADALDAMVDGFVAAGWKKAAPAMIPAGDAREVLTATAKPARPRKAPSTAVANMQAPTTAKPSAAKTAAKSTPATPAISAPKPASPKVANAPAPATPATSTPERLHDDRTFATRPRAIGALQNELVTLAAARDRATSDDKSAALLRVAEVYMELDYAATAAGDEPMAEAARRAAIAAYEELHDRHASAIDEAMLFHLAVAYQREGNDAAARRTTAELKRRFPGTKLATRGAT